MQKITPQLCFDTEALEAVNFYVSVFQEAPSPKSESKTGAVTRYGAVGSEVSGRDEGTVMTVVFELEGQEFMALNGGPMFTFSPAISFVVSCENQDEVDHFWSKLSDGGSVEQCGWLSDKYGVSWQIVPTILGELMADENPKKSEQVMEALLTMKKIDIASLVDAYEEE